jgi:hypothetical protein
MTETAGVSLDLVLGEREPAPCVRCSKPLPALDAPRFELEDTDGGVLCLLCADKTHHGLRLVVAVLNSVLDQKAAGNHQAADETLRAITSGLELILEAAPKPRYTRPVRHQPNRRTRHTRKK